VPVDVHVWKIAAQDYGAEFEAGFADRSLTKRIYTQIGDFFRRRLGDHCGWAHSVLFTADLSSFQHRLPQELRRMLPAVSALPGKQAKSKKSKAASAAKTENSGDTTESDVESKPPAPKKKRATQPNVKVEAKSEPSDLVQ
jgi:N-glycosylase/DNA lyase